MAWLPVQRLLTALVTVSVISVTLPGFVETARAEWTPATDVFSSHLVLVPTGIAPPPGTHRISIGTQGLPNYETSFLDEQLHLQVQTVATAFFHFSSFWTAFRSKHVRLIPAVSYGTSPYHFSTTLLSAGLHVPILFSAGEHIGLVSLTVRSLTAGDWSDTFAGNLFSSGNSGIISDVGTILPLNERYALVAELAFFVPFDGHEGIIPLALGARYSRGTFGVQFGLMKPDLAGASTDFLALPFLEIGWQLNSAAKEDSGGKCKRSDCSAGRHP